MRLPNAANAYVAKLNVVVGSCNIRRTLAGNLPVVGGLQIAMRLSRRCMAMSMPVVPTKS